MLDPGEEQLKSEFSGVKKTYLPYNSIIRIDEVEREGTARILQIAGAESAGASSGSPLPFPGRGPEQR